MARERSVHVGVLLTAQRTTWAQYAGAVRRVEDLGFGSVWTFDHLLPFDGPDGGPCFETLTTLSALALLTTRARIGVLVNGVVNRDPATLAKSAAQVDQMSDGRLEFTLGAGWAEREFVAYGRRFPSLDERYEMVDEALTIVRSLWTEHRTTFHGRHFDVEDAPCEPKPRQSPHPPITVGGGGGGVLRAAARHATRWNGEGPPDLYAARVLRLRAACEEAGRDPNDVELSLHPAVALGHSTAEAEEVASRYARQSGVDPRSLRGKWLIGTVSGVRALLERYLDIGVSHFVVGVGHPFDQRQLEHLREAFEGVA